MRFFSGWKSVWLAAWLTLVLTAPAAFAAELSGVWKGSFDLQGSTTPVTLEVKTDGAKLSGTLNRPNAPAATLQDLQLEDNAVTFSLKAEHQGQDFTVLFKGKLSGDTLEGMLSTEGGEWASWLKLKRDRTPPATAGKN